jgi:hypothetical protein
VLPSIPIQPRKQLQSDDVVCFHRQSLLQKSPGNRIDPGQGAFRIIVIGKAVTPQPRNFVVLLALDQLLELRLATQQQVGRRHEVGRADVKIRPLPGKHRRTHDDFL